MHIPNNPQVAYAVHAVKNCHECDPVDEIIGLTQHFTDGHEWMPQKISIYSYINVFLK
jgi:hypothetical protein